MRVLAAFVLSVVVVATGGSVTRAASTDGLYLVPGRLIDVGGYRLNLVCSGRGGPLVIFDAGLEDWSPAWSKVQPSIANVTRTCSYDRAGNGRSDAAPLPRSSAQIVSELHELLANAGERPPYILVGHSFGAYNMRLFADRYLDEVAGIVLVDGSHEDQAAVIAANSPNADRDWTALLAQLRRCHAAALAGLLARPSRLERACTGQFFRGLPERAFSPELNAALIQAARAPKQYAASLGEAELFRTRSAAQLRRARRSFGDVPLRILTGMRHFSDSAERHASAQRYERDWQALQRSWLPLSTNARQILASHSGHYVQLDEPQLVIDAIREEIALARKPHH